MPKARARGGERERGFLSAPVRGWYGWGAPTRKGNFEFSQGNLKFQQKFWKRYGLLELEVVIFLNVDNNSY